MTKDKTHHNCCVEMDGRLTKRRASRHFDGRLAVIQMPRSVNWFHWLIQCLPKLKTLMDSGADYDAVHVGSMTSGMRESFDLAIKHLGYPNVYQAEGPTTAKSVVVPDIAWYPSEGLPFPPWIAEFLWDIVRPEPCEGYKHIFLSRRGFEFYVRHRAVEHLLLLLDAIRMVELHKLPFREQAKIIASAEVIISPEGSALANTVFARPGTRVIELLNPRNDSFMFARIAHAVGCFHTRMPICVSETPL